MQNRTTSPKSRKSVQQIANAMDAESQIRSILETAVDGIITIDEGGIVDSFNPAAERIFGYQAVEVIGKNIKILMPEPFHSELDGYLKNYRDTGDKKIIGIGREVEGRRKDGTVVPLELSVGEFHIGGQRKFTGFLRNIAERIEADKVIRQQREALLEIATPVIRLWDEIVLLPLVGVLDTSRAQQIIERLLHAIVETESRVAILDVTGVPIIDTTVAGNLIKTVTAASMLGAEVILTGISPANAQTMTELGVDMQGFRTSGSLRSGVKDALEIIGIELRRIDDIGQP